MVNNSTNINYTNNHLLPQIIELKKHHDNMKLEIQVLAGEAIKLWQVKPINGIYPLLII